MISFSLHSKKLKQIITLIGSVLFLITIMIIAFGSGTDVDIEGHFINSDTLYQPSLYIDLVKQENSISTWELNPAPNFFPDSFLYFILMRITNSITWSSFLFFIVQTTLITLLFTSILRVLGAKDFLLKSAFVAIPLLVLFPLISLIHEDFLFYFYFITNSYHIGSFVNSLLIVYLLLALYNRLKTQQLSVKSATIFYVSIISLVCIGVLSDRLIIMGLSVPVVLSLILTLVFKKETKFKPIIVLVSLVLTGTGIGELTRKALIENGLLSIEEPHSFLNYENISSSFDVYYNQMQEYIKEWSLKSFLIVLCFLTLFVHIIKLISDVKSKELKPQFVFFRVYVIASSLCLIAAPILAGNYTGHDTIRYNHHVFTLLLMSISLLISIPEVVRNYAIHLSTTLFIASLILFISTYTDQNYKEYFQLYPEKARAADEFYLNTGLKHGTGDYWDAKLITMFSKEGVVIVPTFYNTVPYFHANNKQWYFNANSKSQEPLNFSFSLIDFIERESQLRTKFPNQVDTMTVGGYKFAIHPPYHYNEDLTITSTKDN